MLTLQPNDCLGGGLHREPFGVRAMWAPHRPKPQPVRETKQRARKPVPGGAPTPAQPQKRATENVVILKRGEKIAREVLAALTVPPAKKAQPAPAAEAETMAAARLHKRTMEDVMILKRGVQIGPEVLPVPVKKTEPAADANQRGSLAEAAESMAGAGQCSAQAKDEPVASAGDCDSPAKKEEGAAPAEVAEPPAVEGQCGATEPAPAAVQCHAPAKEEEVVDAAVADMICTQAEMAGPSPAEGQCGVPKPTPAAGPCDAPVKKKVVAAEDKLSTQAEMAVAEPSPAEGQCGQPTKIAEAALVVEAGLPSTASPEPFELPIPVLLMKPRRGRTRTAAPAC